MDYIQNMFSCLMTKLDNCKTISNNGTCLRRIKWGYNIVNGGDGNKSENINLGLGECG